MLSKDRLLSAISYKEPDHVPLTFRWIIRQFGKDRTWRDQFERAEMELKLGLDPMLQLAYAPAWKLDPGVKIHLWREPPVAGEQYPIMTKEYHTKKGVLKQVVRQTPDWPYGDFVPLWSDHMIPRSRSKKYLIGDMNDVEAFGSLFNDPAENEQKQFLEEAETVKRFADERCVFVENMWTLQMGDVAAWSFGVENLISACFKNPEIVHRFLDILLEWNIMYLEKIAEPGVADMVSYRAWYENVSFWPPKVYRTFLFPRVKKLVEVAHRLGVKFCYVISIGIIPLLDLLKDLNIDVLFGIDPVEDKLGGADLQRIKNAAGGDICLWGGVNSYVTLTTGAKQLIETETAQAIRILGPGGGFILSAIDSLDKQTPWGNIEHMIGIWRKLGKYPITST